MMFKRADKEKEIVGHMKGDGELDMFLNEIPHVTSANHHHGHHHHNHHMHMSVSPISSSSFSGRFCSSDDGSPSLTPFEETKYQTPSICNMDGLRLESKSLDCRVGKNANEYMLDELSLSRNLHRMHIGDEHKDYSRMTQFRVNPYGFGFSDLSLAGTIPRNVEKYGSFNGLNNDVYDYGEFQSPLPGNSMGFNDNTKSAFLGLRRGYQEGSTMGSYLSRNQSNILYPDPGYYNRGMDYPLERTREQGSNCYHRGNPLQNPSRSRPYLNDALFCSQQCGMNSIGDMGVLNSLNSPQLMHPKVALSKENVLCKHSMLNERRRAIPNSRVRAIPNNGVHQSRLSMRGAGDLEAFTCEDSFIIQGKSFNCAINTGCGRSRGHKKNSCNEIALRNLQEKSSEVDSCSHYGGVCENVRSPRSYCPLLLQANYSSLAEVQGYIYFVAKDQHGCRFLQRIFDEGTCEDVQIIFNEIIDRVVELMINPFGNYLIQKLLDVCNEEQRMQIVLMVTKEPGELVRISLNTHGTRVVQKLIETLKTRQQISLVILALEPGFLDLIKDLNGNHVVQRCLQCLSIEETKFIFEAAAKFCVDIATHQHGCCVLQRCIAHSIGEHREKLVAEICNSGILLAQDTFGNYVVQYIIELKIPSAVGNLISQFKGNYVHLSMQKFSSHVVEKCLKYSEESRSRIVHELLSVSHFEQLLQDPFANYVIQSALEVTKGSLHASLVEAVRPHSILRTSPYCKRIFSRNLLKK